MVAVLSTTLKQAVLALLCLSLGPAAVPRYGIAGTGGSDMRSEFSTTQTAAASRWKDIRCRLQAALSVLGGGGWRQCVHTYMCDNSSYRGGQQRHQPLQRETPRLEVVRLLAYEQFKSSHGRSFCEPS